MAEKKEQAALPETFRARMKKLLGEEAEEFFCSYEQERAYGLRYNPLKFSSRQDFEETCAEKTGFCLSPVPWCQEGYYYNQDQQPGKHPWHEAGAYYIQEPSAMSAVELLGAEPGEVICDLCAAPGGKTTQIAGKMQGQGLLVSNEFYGSRAKILAQNVERLGIANGVVLNESTEHLSECFPGFFDRILVDAPCSGEGMFRKDKKAAQEWSLDNVELCAARQHEILEHAAEMLKLGGVLVYATCTFAPQENEQCIAWFLENHPEFALDRVEIADKYFAPGHPEWAEETADCQELVKTYRLWPHKLRGEGHFAARLVKAGGCGAQNGRSAGSGEEDKENHGRERRAGKSRLSVREEAALSDFREFEKSVLQIDLEERLNGKCVLFGDQLYLMPQEMPGLTGLKVVRAGLHLGTCKKNRFEPAHALALYLKPREVKQAVECKEPLKYLHGEMISCDSTRKGWTLVCVDGLSLGWGKAQNGVVKNHYPKGLRICY